jgi:hypothetical protein
LGSVLTQLTTNNLTGNFADELGTFLSQVGVSSSGFFGSTLGEGLGQALGQLNASNLSLPFATGLGSFLDQAGLDTSAFLDSPLANGLGSVLTQLAANGLTGSNFANELGTFLSQVGVSSSDFFGSQFANGVGSVLSQLASGNLTPSALETDLGTFLSQAGISTPDFFDSQFANGVGSVLGQLNSGNLTVSFSTQLGMFLDEAPVTASQFVDSGFGNEVGSFLDQLSADGLTTSSFAPTSLSLLQQLVPTNLTDPTFAQDTATFLDDVASEQFSGSTFAQLAVTTLDGVTSGGQVGTNLLGDLNQQLGTMAAAPQVQGVPTVVFLSGPATTTAGAAVSLTSTVLDPFGNIDTGYSGTVHFSSTDPDAGLPADYTFTSGSGSTFDNGIHTFNLTFGTAGVQNVTVTDTANSTLSGSDSLVVNPSLTVAPTAVNQSYSVTENQTRTISAPGVLTGDTDPNGLPLTAVSFTNPSHGTLTPDANGDGGFVYKPATGYYGTDSFTYEAADSAATSTPATVAITVNPLAPTVVNQSYSVTENGTLTISAPGVLVNDTDPNSLNLTAVSFTSPAHGTLTPDSNGDGGFVYTPTAGYYGTDSFTYEAKDSVATSTPATVTITVNPLAPTAVNDSYSVTENGTLTISAPGVLSNDTDPNSLTLTAVSFTSPAHGTLTPDSNGDGGIVYKPATGYFGSDSFTYEAADSAATSTPATVTITVNPLAPTAVNNSYRVTENGTLTISAPGLLANDTDPNGLTLTAVSFTNPAHGTLTPDSNGDGGFVYKPAAGYFGSDSFTYEAKDSQASSTPATVTITVGQAPAITSVNKVSFAVGVNSSFAVTATGYPTPTFSLGAGSAALPKGITLNSAAGVLSGTPASGTAGTYAVVITASNSAASVSQNFTLTVTSSSSAPKISSASSATFTVGTAGNFTVTATGSPTPTLSESGAFPAGVTFNPATGILSGTPAAGTGGTYALTIKATNGMGTAASQSFTLTVDQAPAITSPNNATFVVGTTGRFTVTATGFPKPTWSDSGTLPSGVTFNTSTGVLSGTPAAGKGGTYSLTFTATNTVSKVSQSFTLTVNQAPAITSATSTTFTVGTAGSFTVTATGFPKSSLSLQSGGLPSGVTFNASTGVLSGTPAAGAGGTYKLIFAASNGVGTTATQSFTLTVDQAPTITSPNNATFVLGTTGSFTATAAGFPKPTLSESGKLPSGVTFEASTGVLGGKPASGTSGTYSLTFTASNSVAKVTQTFTLTISATAAAVSPSASSTASPSALLTASTNGSGTTQGSVTANSASVPASQATVTVKTPVTTAVPGEAVPLVIEVSDTNAIAQAAAFTFTVSFGDGDSTSFSSKAPLIVNHVYTQIGTFTVSVTATDEYGHTSKAATVAIKVVPVAVETDPFNTSQTALFVGGTAGNDTIAFASSGRNGIAVTLNGVSEGTCSTNGPLIVMGQGGTDTVNEGSGVKNTVDLLESPTADNIETDLDNEALQWAGLTAAMEILNA